MISFVSSAAAPITVSAEFPVIEALGVPRPSPLGTGVALFVQVTGDGVAVDALRASDAVHNAYVGQPL